MYLSVGDKIIYSDCTEDCSVFGRATWGMVRNVRL